MKYLFLIIISTFTLYASNNSYNIVIQSRFNDTLNAVVQDYGNTISAVGFYKKYNTASKISNATYYNAFSYLQHHKSRYGIYMRLVKLNTKAKIVLSKTINISNISTAVSVVKTPSNGYIVGGYSKNGRLIVTKLTSFGHVVFSKKIGHRHYDTMSKLIRLSSGKILIVGSSMSRVTTYGSMYNNGLGLNDILLVCLSKNGTVLWKHKFGTPYNDRGIDAVEANDGSIVVLGETYYKKSKTIVLMHITNYGDKIWYKTYLDKQHLKPFALAKLRNNKFIISFDTVSNSQQQINLTIFNIQGNILKHVKVPTQYPSKLVDIHEDRNGYIIGVGQVRDNGFFNTDGLWMKLSTSLHLLLQRHYGGRYFDSFKSFVILRDGNYAVVGNKTGINPEVSNMWIMKLNPRGLIVKN